MSYSVTLTICFCWLLSGTGSKVVESTTDDMFEGVNNVAVDFHSQTSVVNSEMVTTSGDHITSTWIWEPIGHERNEIDSESILRYFSEDDSVSEEDDESLDVEAQKEDNWAVNETIELGSDNKHNLKTFDEKRNGTDEKAYLKYERNLRKTNWCFKETEDAKPNYKFKKTEMCCRKHRDCRARRHVKREIHKCSCDIYFHICLKKADTKMAKSIEKLYFNRNIVCYKKYSGECPNKPCAETMYIWKIIPRHLK